MVSFGFIPSKLDGTEQKLQLDKTIKIPKEYSYIKNLPQVIDQGREPICVPCSLSAVINCKLNIKKGSDRDHDVDLKSIFKEYGTKDGMSFKDALKYAKHSGIKTKEGIIKAEKYAMIGSEEVLKQAIVANGPCIGGLPVKDSARRDFWNGFGFEGRHAVAIVGYDKDGFIIRNSWGRKYGHEGYSHIPYKEFNNFLEIWTII